jgi:hypothetical protein
MLCIQCKPFTLFPAGSGGIGPDVPDVTGADLLLDPHPEVRRQQIGVLLKNRSRCAGESPRNRENSSGKTSSSPTVYHGSAAISSMYVLAWGIFLKRQSVSGTISS